MLEGSKVQISIFSPRLDSLIANTDWTTIQDDTLEFSDVAFFDTKGNSYTVVPAQFDIIGTQINSQVLGFSGQFADVPETDGFNGYTLQFDKFSHGSRTSIRDVSLVESYNTLPIKDDDIWSTRDTIYIDLKGLPFEEYEGYLIQLDLKVDGTKRSDFLYGDTGDDFMSGRKGHDFLAGGSGNDIIKGSSGNDTIDGGAGNDRLLGNRGRDTFLFNAGNDLVKGGLGVDTAVFEGSVDDYSIKFGKRVVVEHDYAGDRDRLVGIEKIEFYDATYVRDNGDWVELG